MQRSGKYQLQLTYGCRPLDAGGRVRVRIGKQTIEHQVEATATGDQFDTFTAGMIELEKGNAELAVEVVSAPGSELMRLNKIILGPK